MTDKTGPAQQRDQPTQTAELAAKVALLAEQMKDAPADAVATIDAITYELDRLRQELVTQARREMDELLARAKEIR